MFHIPNSRFDGTTMTIENDSLLYRLLPCIVGTIKINQGSWIQGPID